MGINLEKGQKIDLSKGSDGLKTITVGLGWDPVQKKGLLGGLFGGASIDCDASVILLDDNDKMKDKNDLVYYSNLKNDNGSIVHLGDNRTGQGDGDDEQIMLDLKKIPDRVKKIVFVVNIYNCVSKKQDFGMIQNAYIRIVDSASNTEICKFNLSENYAGKTTLVVGEVYNKNSEWKFNALGQATQDKSLSEIVNRYR